jgi:hypothetical protein
MGKQYTTDTLGLEGVETFNELTLTDYKLTQISANVAFDGKERILPVFSAATVGPPPKVAGQPTTTVSIGGFVDETIPIEPISVLSPSKIRFYTGEEVDPAAVQYYPGAERLTINGKGRVGINSPNNQELALDVREALPSAGFGGAPSRPRTSSIAITQPFYKDRKGGDTTPEFGNIFFRANVSEKEDNPVIYSLIKSGNAGQVQNSYEDQRANLQFYTNTGDGEGEPELVKHLEINGFENKTKIFTQLNLGNVPVFRDQAEAVKEGGLVNGDVYQDRLQNLKIVFLLEEGERARIE